MKYHVVIKETEVYALTVEAESQVDALIKAEVLNSPSSVIGSRIRTVWFWTSPVDVYNAMLETVNEGHSLANFRRV